VDDQQTSNGGNSSGRMTGSTSYTINGTSETSGSNDWVLIAYDVNS